MPIPFSLLKQQDSLTSNAVVAAFEASSTFQGESKLVTNEVLQRDSDDASQLQEGIDLAVGKGVIPATVDVEETYIIDVLGRSVEEVTNAIITKLGSAAQTGCIMTLQGLSGTGKGTTVASLKEKLPSATTWSNGNIFRSLTLLAVTYAEQNNISLQEALTPPLLAQFVGMLTFTKIDGKFDVVIDGLGVQARVSEVQNTLLKQPKVSTVIPKVAGVTQGEVINFVQAALNEMAASGVSVLLEGRAQTLNYIRTPHRFELVLSDPNIIGQRRVAQVMGAEALHTLGNKENVNDEEVMNVLKAALKALKQKRAALAAAAAKPAVQKVHQSSDDGVESKTDV